MIQLLNQWDCMLLGEMRHLKQKRRIGEKPFLIELNSTEAIDAIGLKILKLAYLIAIGLREQERRLFNNSEIAFDKCSNL